MRAEKGWIQSWRRSNWYWQCCGLGTATSERAESQCEAKLLHDIAHVMGKMGSGKQQMPNIYSFIDLLAQQR